jgi:hypothetical protein
MNSRSNNAAVVLWIGAISIGWTLGACDNRSAERAEGAGQPGAATEQCTYRASLSYGQLRAMGMKLSEEAAFVRRSPAFQTNPPDASSNNDIQEETKERAQFSTEFEKAFIEDLNKIEAGGALSNDAQMMFGLQLRGMEKILKRTLTPCEVQELRSTLWLSGKLAQAFVSVETLPSRVLGVGHEPRP